MHKGTQKASNPKVPFDGCVDRFRAVLRAHGGRLTEERLLLLRGLLEMEGHFQPEAVERRLRQRRHAVSLSTVYRSLPLFVEAGIIRIVGAAGEGKGGALYEHAWGHEHHDHLRCSRCGKRVEFSYPAIDVLQEAVARNHGFELERHQLELVGVCRDCREGIAVRPARKRAKGRRR